MKLYWYELRKGKIVLYEREVKETEKMYKSLDECFPYRWYSQINKSEEGKLLKCYGDSCTYVFFTEKNLEKARELFVESQKKRIESKKSQIERLENEIEELERRIERLEDMEVVE